MDHNKSPVSSEPSAAQNATTNAEHDPQLALTDLLSGVSLDGRQYVEVPMTRSLADALHINQLIEDCLLALFNQFPLQRQLQLRSVCRQWQTIIEQKCRRMRSLKIFRDVTDIVLYCIDLVALNLYGDDRYKLKPVGHDDDLIGSLDQLHQCTYLFADITSLVYEDWHNTCTILDQLSAMFPMLTSLTISTFGSPFTAIHSLPHLTSLHLHYLDLDIVIPESIPILRQLKCFSLRKYYGFHIASILSQLGSQLTHLMLSQVSLSAAQLATALTSNPSLATSVTHLTLGCIYSGPDYSALLDTVCSHLANLVYLNFYFIELSSLPSLAKLHHLTELHVDRFLIPDAIPRHLPAVPTVKQLHFDFYRIPTAGLNIQSLFPAVSEIIIYNLNEDALEDARQYMAQFRFTCLVTFHEQKDTKCFMGRHGD